MTAQARATDAVGLTGARVALCRYAAANVWRSQRWVAPLLVYAAVLGAVYASDAGPAVPAFGVTAGALVPIAAWLTRAVLHVEPEAARDVTAAAAGGQRPVHAAALVTAWCAALPLCLLAVAWAAVADTHVTGWHAYLGGLGLHAAFAVVGTALGALAARPVLPARGPAVLLVVCVVTIGVVARWSPLHWALRVLEQDPARGFAGALAPPLATLLALSAVALAGSVVVAGRR